MTPQDTEAELRDACINIQLKLGLDDKHWYKLCGNFEGLYGFIAAHTKQATDAARIDGNTSDGYHTFNELYEFRKLYNAALFNEWFMQSRFDVHKSKRHHDGELCFGGGWFIVTATLPTGQISNHYEMKDWHLFKAAIRKHADKWDGHTPEDVVKRLLAYLPEYPSELQPKAKDEI